MDIKSTWYVDLYKDHIMVLNGGWEYPGDKKTNIDHFVNEYDRLILYYTTDLLVPKGIRINSNNILVDGAHRFVLAFMFVGGFDWSYYKTTGLDFVQGYNYDFFQNRLKYGIDYLPEDIKRKVIPTLKPIWMDEMAREACYIHRNVRIISVFPCSSRKDIDSLLQKEGQIVYKKTINFTDNGLLRFIYELYDGETWRGYTREDKQLDVTGNSQTNECTFYVFIPKNIGVDMVRLKSGLRIHCENRHSVHINDTHDEALRYANQILNENSIHHLNYGQQLSPTNQKLFNVYRTELNDKYNDKCIDSSFVLALYGLREAKDLDYLHAVNTISFTTVDGINSHNSELKYYDCSVDDILYDPRKHFYTRGCKVATLETVRDMKINRNEEKDRNDIELIDESRLMEL